MRQAKVVAQAPPGVAAGAFLEPAGTVLALLRMEKFSPSIAGMAPPEVIPFSSGPFYGFDRSQDLLGDSSVVLLPTPGHTAGHLAVLVRLNGYQLLCIGDTI